MSAYVATLVNGETYIYKGKTFRNELPQIVTQDEAEALLQATNRWILQDSSGKKSAFYKKKFDVVVMDKAAAESWVEKITAKIKATKKKDEIEDKVIMGARDELQTKIAPTKSRHVQEVAEEFGLEASSFSGEAADDSEDLNAEPSKPTSGRKRGSSAPE